MLGVQHPVGLSPLKVPGGDDEGDPLPPHDPIFAELDVDEDQMKLLYLIYLCTKDKPEATNRWVRELTLMVYVYEGTVDQRFTYDYAPTAYKVNDKRIYLNLSQEGLDDICDLRERDLVVGLKITSQTYSISFVYRLSEKGQHAVTKIRSDLKRSMEELYLRAPPKSGAEPMATDVVWEQEEEKFRIFAENGYSEFSTMSEVEAVSYVSSPYIPAFLRQFGPKASSNANLVHTLADTIENQIKDELSENIVLDDVVLMVAEWLPMGGNQIVSLNEKLGSSERVQGGFFSSMIDENPDQTGFSGEREGLTSVRILDYLEASYVNFEAEVYFPEEEGVKQIENFGIHISESGDTFYGLVVDAIMDRIGENLSLDLMSRLLVDVNNDSSQVVANLLNGHQRALLNLTFLEDADNRDKFNIIFAEKIKPTMRAEKYMDREDNENELKQVVGSTRSAHDLGDAELLVIGIGGVIVAGENSRRHEPVVSAYAGLQARNMFMRSVFSRCHIVADTLQRARFLIDTVEQDPGYQEQIRNMLSECTEQVIMLEEIQMFLVESCDDFAEDLAPLPGDQASEDIFKILNVGVLLSSMKRRAMDIEKTIDGCRNDLSALREMAAGITESSGLKLSEALESNTKNLEDMFRASARNNNASFEIMNVIFAGSIAFQMLDRVTGQYLSIADQVFWVEDYVRPYTANVPLVWFAINMLVWGALGGFIIQLLRYSAYMSVAVEASNTRLAIPCKVPQLRAYMATKNVTTEDINMDPKNFFKKYQWEEEEDKDRWKGVPPKFELKADERYGFILQLFIQVNMRKSKLSCAEAKYIILGELKDAGAIEEVPDTEGNGGILRTDSGMREASEAIAAMRRIPAIKEA